MFFFFTFIQKVQKVELNQNFILKDFLCIYFYRKIDFIGKYKSNFLTNFFRLILAEINASDIVSSPIKCAMIERNRKLKMFDL